jgi:hypothetical protein
MGASVFGEQRCLIINIDPSVTQYAKANLREGMRATRDVI